MKPAEYWIEMLGLRQHPEGGHFAETYRSDQFFDDTSQPSGYNGNRCIATSIYFLLKDKEFSAFHRIRSDETWHFYQGSALEVFVLMQNGDVKRQLLGPDPERGESIQITIPRNHWFAARLPGQGTFALVGCTVAPGFHFDDFELAQRKKLTMEFPRHGQLIKELTYE